MGKKTGRSESSAGLRCKHIFSSVAVAVGKPKTPCMGLALQEVWKATSTAMVIKWLNECPCGPELSAKICRKANIPIQHPSTDAARWLAHVNLANHIPWTPEGQISQKNVEDSDFLHFRSVGERLWSSPNIPWNVLKDMKGHRTWRGRI